MNPGLIDRIYECSFVPEHWPGVLDELAEIADARGGALLAATTVVLNWTASNSLQDAVRNLVKSDLLVRGQRFGRLLRAGAAGFVTEIDHYSEEEMRADPFYSEYLWPMGLGWAAGTAMPLPTGDTIILSLERNRARGPVESPILAQLDALRPHLARSALMSARLQLERARTASETLALIGLPALVFGDQGRVLAANALIEALTGHIRWRAQGRVVLTDANADVMLQHAMAALDTENGGSVQSFAVRDADTNAAMVAHVVPIRGAARDIFVRCGGVLVLTPVTLPQAPPAALIQSLFDLTPAEARVARSLSAGETVEGIASAGGVSLNTVRTQVRGVLEKTGCRRQAEVVALLGGIPNIAARAEPHS